MTYLKKVANVAISWFSYVSEKTRSLISHPDYECTSLESCTKGEWQEGPRFMKRSNEVANKFVPHAGNRLEKPDTCVIDLSFMDEIPLICQPTVPIKNPDTHAIDLDCLEDEETGNIPPAMNPHQNDAETGNVPPDSYRKQEKYVSREALENKMEKLYPSVRYSGRKMYPCVTRIPDHKKTKPYNYTVDPSLVSSMEKGILRQPSQTSEPWVTQLTFFNEVENKLIPLSKVHFSN